jgi:hypothetical protein
MNHQQHSIDVVNVQNNGMTNNNNIHHILIISNNNDIDIMIIDIEVY